jgi:hypothetical protein
MHFEGLVGMATEDANVSVAPQQGQADLAIRLFRTVLPDDQFVDGTSLTSLTLGLGLRTSRSGADE